MDIVPILLCYVLFCNGVWPLFNKRLFTYLLMSNVQEVVTMRTLSNVNTKFVTSL